MSISLQVGNLPNSRLAFNNCAYVSVDAFQEILRHRPAQKDNVVFIRVNDQILPTSSLSELTGNTLALNMLQRKAASLVLGAEVNAVVVPEAQATELNSITVTVAPLIKKAGTKSTADAEELQQLFQLKFGEFVLSKGSLIVMDVSGVKLELEIEELEVNGSAISAGRLATGATKCVFKLAAAAHGTMVLTGGQVAARNDSLFKANFDFASLGIGGLDSQFKRLFRTAFASRMFPGMVKQLGTNHVRGILLYGPPGCGKTLIARQIGKILNSREPKIVNGPEILDKYVGGSEEKIRALFADAEKEQAEAGDQSMLHIIILDEMDAILKSRGSGRDSTGVSDSVVNQFLSKIDGVDSLNNILLIGMTNRKDMIDEAILRPGRLEVHIEISLPDETGRSQILNIKTANMRENKRMSPEAVDRLPELAQRTKNFTGAELEGLVRNAATFALSRSIDPSALKGPVDEASIRVEWSDFEHALAETVPAFGAKDAEEIRSYVTNGIHSYGPSFDTLWSSMNRLVNQVRTSARTPLMSVLLEGAVGTGKTAMAAALAIASEFPFVRMISAASMIGKSDGERCDMILRVFQDAYRSPMSMILIDDFERIIEFSPVGARFLNSTLQTLLILLRKVPRAPCRLMVVTTSSMGEVLAQLQADQAFHVRLTAPLLTTPSEYAAILTQYSTLSSSMITAIAKSIPSPLGVKQLLMVLEMALAEAGEAENVTVDQFMGCLLTVMH